MKVMITAGGTTEKIDSVRSIANISTGRLGSLIANAYFALSEVDEIYYLCSKTAMLPRPGKTKIIHVESVASLESAVRSVLQRGDVDIIVHSMAVSDYRVKTVTSTGKLAGLIASRRDLLKGLDDRAAEEMIAKLLCSPESVIGRDGKISSDLDGMVLFLERTPKIISMFQNLSPKSILVGFKLLDNVSEKTLVDTAFELLEKNKCSFVLANDLRGIGKDQHIGYLIDPDKNYERYTTKEEIAGAIAAATMEKRRNER